MSPPLQNLHHLDGFLGARFVFDLKSIFGRAAVLLLFSTFSQSSSVRNDDITKADCISAGLKRGSFFIISFTRSVGFSGLDVLGHVWFPQ